MCMYITVHIRHALSSSFTKTNEEYDQNPLYKYLTSAVLLNININNLNSATSRQARRVVDNTTYQHTLKFPNGYNATDQCVDVLVMDRIKHMLIICGLIWNANSVERDSLKRVKWDRRVSPPKTESARFDRDSAKQANILGGWAAHAIGSRLVWRARIIPT